MSFESKILEENMPKLLFVTTAPFYPDSSGGAELSTLYLFSRLCHLGWQVEVICSLSVRTGYLLGACILELGRLRKPSISLMDRDLGYPCWRVITKNNTTHDWLVLLDQRLCEYKPDMVMGSPNPMCPLLTQAAHMGYPSFYYAHNLAAQEGGYKIPNKIHVIANAPYTASQLSRMTQREMRVVLEMIDPELYRVNKHDNRYITFINPIPEKGLHVAIEIARSLPDECFLFVKGGWPGINDDYQASLLQPVRVIPNVEIWDNQKDMRSVYEVTDILLVPSQFIETFGRVIIEAQLNGIPVVAANVGGVPYTLGQGGILVTPKDSPAAYVDALRQLRRSRSLYSDLSIAAIRNSERPEFDPQQQVYNFIRIVENFL